jgi:hypothetical protein
MPSPVQQRNAAVEELRPRLPLVTETPAAIPTVETIRTDPLREERICRSDDMP